MKKILIILLALVILALPCFAELKQFTRTINVKVENNSIFITGDNLNWDRDLTPSITISGNSTTATVPTFEKQLSYSWVENVTADTDLQLYSMQYKLDNMTASMNDVKVNTNYYDKYVQCVSDRDSCNVIRTENTDTQSKLSLCTNDLNGKSNSLNDISSQKTACDTALTSTKTDLQNKDSQNGFLWFAIVILGIICIFMGLKLKPFGKMNKSPTHDDISKDFDKLN